MKQAICNGGRSQDSGDLFPLYDRETSTMLLQAVGIASMVSSDEAEGVELLRKMQNVPRRSDAFENGFAHLIDLLIKLKSIDVVGVVIPDEDEVLYLDNTMKVLIKGLEIIKSLKKGDLIV